MRLYFTIATVFSTISFFLQKVMDDNKMKTFSKNIATCALFIISLSTFAAPNPIIAAQQFHHYYQVAQTRRSTLLQKSVARLTAIDKQIKFSDYMSFFHNFRIFTQVGDANVKSFEDKAKNTLKPFNLAAVFYLAQHKKPQAFYRAGAIGVSIYF